MSTNPTDSAADRGKALADHVRDTLIASARLMAEQVPPASLIDELHAIAHNGDEPAVRECLDRPVSEPPLIMPAHFGPTPLPSGRAASDALYRAVSKMARDICDGYAWSTKAELADNIAEAQTWSEWQNLRALYFVYCNGFEDALYDCSAILACAIRDNKPQWIGDVVIEAWAKYADQALTECVLSKIQEIKEDDAAVRQSESVGK